jgi:hypothetical protein
MTTGSHQPGTSVKVNASIIVKDEAGKPHRKALSDEPGVIRKISGDDLYVETQYGTHYLHHSFVTVEETVG